MAREKVRVGYTITSICAKCGGTMAVRYNKTADSYFLGCTRYPMCKGTAQYDEFLHELVEERAALEEKLSVAGSGKSGGVRALQAVTEAIFNFHPDRAGASVSTHEVAAALNKIRAALKS